MRGARLPPPALVVTLCALLVPAQQAPAADLMPEAETFFETKIRPLLIDHCFECHCPGQQMKGLRLDSLAAMLAGGERGPALLPGDPAASLLIKAVQYETRKLKMPPQRPAPATRSAAGIERAAQAAEG